jgi:hypothetical protein
MKAAFTPAQIFVVVDSQTPLVDDAAWRELSRKSIKARPSGQEHQA